MTPEPISDGELLRRFSRGDRDAFAALYRLHYPAIFRFAIFMTANSDAACEITQQTFMWLIHHPGDFDPGRGELPAFLTGVARKMLHRRDREERRWRPLEDISPVPHPGGRADSTLDNQLDAATLRRAILFLPETYREAVVLCDLQGKTYEEAAAVLDCAVGTVRSRLHRARRLLSRKLQQTKHEDSSQEPEARRKPLPLRRTGEQRYGVVVIESQKVATDDLS